MRRPESPLILTVGHSTRTLEEFVRLLKAHSVTLLVDVRTVPRSRRNPQFNRDTLPASLEEAGIGYVHIPELGGLRKPRPDSPNTAWRNESFRGFADYMFTPEFEAGVDKLLSLAENERCAIMCAEIVPWRCHRSLIGDALLVRGDPVEDIMTEKHREPHTLTPFARVEGGRLVYDGEQG